ncbi:MAG: glycosyltransferase [Roseiflexaceae bacterium]
MQRLKVVHLSTNDVAGGAARAAYRLHQGLQRLGHQSQMLVANKSSSDPQVLAFAPPRDPIGRVARHLRRSAMNRDMARYQATRPAGLEPFSDDRSMHAGAVVRQIPTCDIINLHWVAGFVDYTNFFRVASQRAPIVWRLSDINPFTGGCHYDEGCGRFSRSCGACPQLGSTDPNDLSAAVLRRKQAALASIPQGRLHIVALSRWIAEEARRSKLFRDLPISIIPNGIDPHTFAPRDTLAARQALGIAADQRVVMFSAGSVTNRRKGFAELVEALRGLGAREDLTLVSLGSGKQTLDLPFRHLALGHTSDDNLIAQVYSAADLFVIPSLQENLPNTALEAMACGTPVVGFDAGGIPDLVRHGHTGLLVPVGDVAGLGQAIATLLNEPNRLAAMALEGRRVVLADYTPELQVQRYVELYHRLIEASSHGV